MDLNKTALLFPGQGSQIIGMGKDFYENFKEAKQVFEEASDTISVDLKKLCFDGPMEDLTLTENLQPCLFTTEMAIFTALKIHTDIKPIVVAGHSLGEYSALGSAGSLSIADGTRLTRKRGKAMQDAVPVGRGTMAAVLRLDQPKVEELCKRATDQAKGEVVEPANYNAPGQIVISGTVDGVAKASSLLANDPDFKGGKSLPLKVSAPFHCSLMMPAKELMEADLMKTSFHSPSCKVIPNATARVESNEKSFAHLLSDQIIKPVLWEQSMKQLKSLGVEHAIEVGPGKVLSGLMKRIDRTLPVMNLSNMEELRSLKS